MRTPRAMPFVLMLLVASALVLTRLADVRFQPAVASGSPRAISTVRAYYDAVSFYLHSGDMSGVQSVVAPAILGDAEPHGSTGGLSRYLHALRQTYPSLRLSVDTLTSTADSVIAQVTVESGPRAGPDTIQPLGMLANWQMTEIFEVDEGTIIYLGTSGPGLGLFSTDPGFPFELPVKQLSRVVIARLNFDAESASYIRVRAPAMLIPLRGQVSILGDGVTGVHKSGATSTEATKHGISAIAATGEAIVVRRSGAHVKNGAGTPAEVMAIILEPASRVVEYSDRESHHDLLAEALQTTASSEIAIGVVATVMASGPDVIESGNASVLSGWAVLTSGGGITIRGAVTPAMAFALGGTATIRRDEADRSVTVSNLESGLAEAWAVIVDT